MKNPKNSWKQWLDGDLDLLADVQTCSQQPIEKSKRRRPSVLTEYYEGRLEPRELNSFRRLYTVLSIVVCLALALAMMITVSWLPAFGSADVPANNEVAQRYLSKAIEETGATSAVAGMILDYRAFDTLGESFVLFTAACCVFILLRRDTPEPAGAARERESFDLTRDPILTKMSHILVPLIFLLGIYVILNGHLSPGGGFSGGAILGAGLILFSISHQPAGVSRFFNLRTYRVITVSALSFYCLAKSYSFFTGANGLASGIPLGTPGAIFSSGLILPLNIAVGLVVACTMYGFYSLFEKGEV